MFRQPFKKAAAKRGGCLIYIEFNKCERLIKNKLVFDRLNELNEPSQIRMTRTREGDSRRTENLKGQSAIVTSSFGLIDIHIDSLNNIT